MAVRVRRAEERDLERVGELTVAAYAGFTLGPTDPYLDRLRDAAARAREAELWVAVSDGDDDGLEDDTVLGSVTDCPRGSPWREIGADDEGEFRMLAVDPAAQGRGAGRALVAHVEARWRTAGARGMALSSLARMSAAHRLYATLGYRRAPERDWSPLPGTELVAFTKELR